MKNLVGLDKNEAKQLSKKLNQLLADCLEQRFYIVE